MPDDSVTAVAEIAFINDWFDVTAKPVWDRLIPEINPSRILEIGSFEGASACYLIAACAAKAPIELHCIDTWEGGDEHKQAGTDMSSVGQVPQQHTYRPQSSVAARRARNPQGMLGRTPGETDRRRFPAAVRPGLYRRIALLA